MADTSERNSRIPGFYRLSRSERLDVLVERGFLRPQDRGVFDGPRPALSPDVADKMVENVVGLFELPVGMGLNFTINGRDYVVPMVVEEPSVVAAVSHAALLVRRGGGFEAEADRSVMIGQLQVVGSPHTGRARAALEEASAELIALANEVEPGMSRRGGGAVELRVRHLRPEEGRRRFREMIVVHLLVDVCDAMGANVINTMAEGIAARVEELTGGSVFLRILSNLATHRRVRARCRVPLEELRWKEFSGEEIADGVVRASEFAAADPYRAATHNKGIMNGIDAVAIATGNDWRALEAGAHAWAAHDGRYGPLAVWERDGDGHLVGSLEMPMAVGTVGGPIKLHPAARANLEILGISDARELACVLGAVGLAQNLAAIKALGSTGIQRGHMALHARAVAATAGATGADVERVAERLIREGQIKVERAVEILGELG